MINKKILIIGGTGALGRTLVRRYQDTNSVMVLSRDEHKQVNMRNMDNISPSVLYKIGDVKDKDSIRNAIEGFRPQVVINAAAIKHVPVCEDNPYESVNVNIIGHQNLIQQVERSTHQIETLIFVSTDKACKPINVYGMSKAIAERLYVDYSKRQRLIKVCIVRYGNVLESTGSVIPFFKNLLAADQSFLPITDFKMTRFLLTLERATDLIDWAYTEFSSHGCIAIPKVQSFSIVDIANALIRSTGKHVELREVGIRPGEKLHEEMISQVEWTRTVEFADNFLITDEVLRKDRNSYNSSVTTNSKDVYKFLQDSGVIQ